VFADVDILVTLTFTRKMVTWLSRCAVVELHGSERLRDVLARAEIVVLIYQEAAGPPSSAHQAGPPRQEQRDLGPDDQDHEADQQGEQIWPVRAEVLAHRDVAEAQRHQETDADRR